MAKTCPNGHVNDDANRFCDQCGAPLPQNADPASAVAEAPATGSATSGTACPVCGQENMPGTAFCDNCGAALPPPQPAAAAEAQPVAAAASEPVAAAADDTAAGGSTVTCAQCGTVNDAANRFCDNCGATLAEASQPAQIGDSVATSGDMPATLPDADLTAATPTDSTTIPDAGQPAPADAPAGDAAAPPDLTAPDSLAAATPVPADSGTAAPAASAPDVDRQALEEQIGTQRKLVEQLEQMQASFGAATPASIRQGLDEARTSLAQSEAQLAALPPARPAADPAEVARMEEQIGTQRKLVEQLEQMQASFGAATPASIRQGLDEARASLAQSESELQQLTGGAGAAPARPLPSALDIATQRADDQAQSPDAGQAVAAAPAPEAPRSVEPAAAPAQPDPTPVAPPSAPAPQAAMPSAPAPQAAPPVQSQGQSQVSGPHFLTRDGKQIPLPAVAEVVVGREDPISGIHPELDMTPFGGEAGGVSRRHAVLREQNGAWSVTDLDSTNYTRVDGNRLPANTPTPINDGSRVQFGRIELEFRMA